MSEGAPSQRAVFVRAKRLSFVGYRRIHCTFRADIYQRA